MRFFGKRNFLSAVCFFMTALLLVSCAGTVADPNAVSVTPSAPSLSEESTASSESLMEETTSSAPEQEESTVEPYKHVVVIGVDGAGGYFR